MRWLIVEDALRNKRGHWFEYLGTFHRELPLLGDAVTTLVDRGAEPFIRELLDARPVLPPSIWHRMGDGAGPLRRYGRVPAHAWATVRSAGAWLRVAAPPPDAIFVPTVLVHHLLGWAWLIKRRLRHTRTCVLLFFPNTPISLDVATGVPSWNPAPTSRLFHRLVRWLRPEVAAGRVVLGAETHAMRDALTTLTGVPFVYLPHPVVLAHEAPPLAPRDEIVMASFGAARAEKGPEVLVAAIEQFVAARPQARVRFIMQTVDASTDSWQRLRGHPRVELITEYFREGEYQRNFQTADVLLLPYRVASYSVRVSRVVIEAMICGRPVVTTRRTTLAEQVAEFGAGTFCDDGDAPGLAAAIGEMAARCDELRQQARARQARAREHFSVATFRDILRAAAAPALVSAEPDRRRGS